MLDEKTDYGKNELTYLILWRVTKSFYLHEEIFRLYKIPSL